MKLPLIVGLTGGIGSGKTTVSKMFEKLGVPVIDADVIAHDIVKPGQPGLDKIKQHFPDEYFNSDGSLDRNVMRQAIFNKPELKKKLESLLHPIVYSEISRRCKLINYPYCLVVIPLLLESGGEDYVDRVLVVTTHQGHQISRVSSRDEVSHEDVEKILAHQARQEARLEIADDIIENNAELEALESKVQRLHHQYLELTQHQ